MDKSSARTGGGTGLGLAIAKNIIEVPRRLNSGKQQAGAGKYFLFCHPQVITLFLMIDCLLFTLIRRGNDQLDYFAGAHVLDFF